METPVTNYQSNVKVFGEKYNPVTVKLRYEPNPGVILNSLTEFVYKQAKLIDFRTEKPQLWVSIFNAILSSESQEHKVFKANVADLVAEAKERAANVDSTEDLKIAQIRADIDKILESQLKQPDPHFWTKTVSIIKKQQSKKGNFTIE